MLYVGLDTGKFATKLCFPGKDHTEINYIKYRTKIGPGSFKDAMQEKGTPITSVNGDRVYKIGFGAPFEAEMETSKMSDTHRICALTAVAMAVSSSGDNAVKAAIGCPLDICKDVEKYHAFQDYIFGPPGMEHTVRFRRSVYSPIEEVNFHFESRFVFPEGAGAACDLIGSRYDLEGHTIVIDIGNRNTNYLYFNSDSDLVMENSFTDENGGKEMIFNLSQLLSRLGGRCDERITAQVLTMPYEKRFIEPKRGDETIKEKSREVIDNYLMSVCREIRQRCHAGQFSLDYMNIVFIGGTAALLERELRATFGDNIIIPERPEYINASGFLKKICADDGIDMTSVM